MLTERADLFNAGKSGVFRRVIGVFIRIYMNIVMFGIFLSMDDLSGEPGYEKDRRRKIQYG